MQGQALIELLLISNSIYMQVYILHVLVSMHISTEVSVTFWVD